MGGLIMLHNALNSIVFGQTAVKVYCKNLKESVVVAKTSDSGYYLISDELLCHHFNTALDVISYLNRYNVFHYDIIVLLSGKVTSNPPELSQRHLSR